MNLNDRTARLCQKLDAMADDIKIAKRTLSCGTTIWDFGVEVDGGLVAGRTLAQVCLADLAEVEIVPSPSDLWTGPSVQVSTDQPIAACMAAQYAGWQIIVEKYFAMGSGPMRAAAGSEELFNDIGRREKPLHAIGVLETSQFPSDEVALQIAEACGVAPDSLTLLVAPTASQAGSFQIVARSVETALHKLHELGFDLERVVSGYGVAPLPPVAENDLEGIGRTNDSILYGARTTLWVRGDDDSLRGIIERVPSSASSDYGRPFKEIFASYDHDFYQIDPHLFSPATIQLFNLDTGSAFTAGKLRPELIRKSFLS